MFPGAELCLVEEPSTLQPLLGLLIGQQEAQSPSLGCKGSTRDKRGSNLSVTIPSPTLLQDQVWTSSPSHPSCDAQAVAAAPVGINGYLQA